MTPQQIDAMKMALEALKTSMYPQQKQLQAITALEEALAEHAMQEVQRLGQEIEPDDIASILACRDMLDAQPVPEVDRVIWPESTEQEPVISKWVLREVYFDEDGEPISHRSPPQRKPLTVQEIAAFVGTHQYGPEQLKWFRIGEAAHGIKENT